MSVFRAAASDPAAYRPSIEGPHSAGAVPHRHPLPPGQWVPPQRTQDSAYSEGPTEPLGAIREAAAREAALREAEAREVALREAEAREVALREAEAREASSRQAALREAELREAAIREAAIRESEAREASFREAVAKETAARETAVRDAAARDAAAREADTGDTDVSDTDARNGEPKAGQSREAARDSTSRADAGIPPGRGTTVPAERGRPARRRRRVGVVLAVFLSLLALVISGVAGFLSWRTFTAARVEVPAPQASSVAAPAPAQTRPLRPEQYPVAYAKEPLRPQFDCAAVVFLDLDEPRADAAEALADLRYESRCGTRLPQLSLGAGAAAGSRQASADTDAAGCDRAIRTSPLGRGLQVEVRKGGALCVLTAAVPAELVLVEVIDVGGSGTAGLRATSWQVP
jgi:hypothetical protein